MSIRDLQELPPPPPDRVTVVYTSPGGIAVKPFADRYLAMRVCLGHIDHAEDGLMVEVGREPVPWESEAVREEAIVEIRRRARKAKGEARSALVRLLEHVVGTPYYEDA